MLLVLRMYIYCTAHDDRTLPVTGYRGLSYPLNKPLVTVFCYNLQIDHFSPSQIPLSCPCLSPSFKTLFLYSYSLLFSNSLSQIKSQCQLLLIHKKQVTRPCLNKEICYRGERSQPPRAVEQFSSITRARSLLLSLDFLIDMNPRPAIWLQPRKGKKNLNP